MNSVNVALRRCLWGFLITMGVSCTPPKAAPPEVPPLSSCGDQVLKESKAAYDVCFPGNSGYGACETCGYNTDRSAVQSPRDCVTCPEGHEIDVYFADCTGYCVPKGTAKKPIATSQCRPVSQCVREVAPTKVP